MKKVNYDEQNYKIWFWAIGRQTGIPITGRYVKEYKTKGWARRVAEQVYGGKGYSWMISKENPFRKKCPMCGKVHYVTGSPFVENKMTVIFNGMDPVEKIYTRETVSFTQFCDDCFNKFKNIMLYDNDISKLKEV